MRNLFIIIFTIIIISFISCEEKEKGTMNKTGTLQGTIGIYEGNCMPGPESSLCEHSPISTTVAITYPAEYFNAALLVDSVITSEDGTFEMSLPEGYYSLFIRDSAEFICDRWNCQNECNCTLFKIKNDSVTIVNANIDHATW
ncbi:MAG: hypothetical protein JW894_03025 [Bacteroidales bacterium]|nr:hypothetical protein [Bacteroidales bacterium]